MPASREGISQRRCQCGHAHTDHHWRFGFWTRHDVKKVWRPGWAYVAAGSRFPRPNTSRIALKQRRMPTSRTPARL